MPEHAGLSVDNPLDIAVIDDLIDRFAHVVGVPATLLAADRRGRTLGDFGRALVTTLASTAPKRFKVAEDRAVFLGELAESADFWGFAEKFPDKAIEGVVRGFRGIDCNEGFGDAEILMLLDAVGSLQREGYNLHWFAGRASRAYGLAWPDVILAANAITNAEARAAREALLQ